MKDSSVMRLAFPSLIWLSLVFLPVPAGAVDHVVGKISDARRYESLNPHFAKAFDFLRRKDLSALPVGRYEIDGSNCWAMVQETPLVPLAERKVECHRQYIDIQSPISGPEAIGLYTMDAVHLALPFNAKDDYVLFDDTAKPVTLRPGEFGIFFPPCGGHAPSCRADGSPDLLRKLVIKVRDERVNLARGRHYAFTMPAQYALCKDAGDMTQLADGEYVTGPGTIWTQKGTVGWQGGGDFTFGVKFDLGRIESFSGFSFDFAAGAAGVQWPKFINVYVSDDGKDWTFVDDLLARSKEENGSPAMDGYAVYCARSRSMPAKGRHVAFYMRTGTFGFCDEIEIYAGPEPKDWNPVSVGTPEKHIASFVMGDCITRELERLIARRGTLPAAERWEFDAEVAHLRERIAGLAREPFDEKLLTVVPLHPVHAEVMALNRRFLRASGLVKPEIWTNDRWANLDPLSVPGRSARTAAPLAMEMMRGETRATAFNVANPTDRALDCTVEIVGLPETAHVDCREGVFTYTKARECVGGALRPGEGREVSLRIPSGASGQVWISFAKPSGAAGEFQGAARVKLSDGTHLERSIRFRLHDLDFPQRPRLHVYGWDYTYGKADTFAAPGNLKSNLTTMREIFTDMPWAHVKVLPSGAKFDGEGNLTNADRLDFRLWDEWLARWPDARCHAVFLQSGKDGFFGEPVGTPRFDRMVGDYFRMLAGRYRKATGPSARLLLMPVDEPGGSWFKDNAEVKRQIVGWAKAVKAAAPEIGIFEDPIYSDPADGDGMFDCVDVICMSAGAFAKPGNGTFRDYYFRRQKEGKELWLYFCCGPSRTLDPEFYYRALGWLDYQIGGKGMGFWAFGCGGGQGDSWHAFSQPGVEYSPYFVSSTETMVAKQSEGIREGVEDYEYLVMLESFIADAARRGHDVTKARAVLEAAPAKALCQPARFERPNPIRWDGPHVRGTMDAARIEVLRTISELR